MRARAPLLVAILVASTAAGAAVTGPVPATQAPVWIAETQPHSPILIQGDEEFTADNGVRGGSGTPEDPYRIANWTIPTIQRHMGLKLVDTDDHVIVENVFVPAYTGSIPLLANCVQPPEITCPPVNATIGFEGASNVTVENVRVTNGAVGLGIEEGDNVTVEGASLGDPDAGPSANLASAVVVRKAADVSVEDIEVKAASWVLDVDEAENLTVADSSFVGNTGLCTGSQCRGTSSGFIDDSRDVALVDNSIQGVELWMRGLEGSVEVARNTVSQVREGVKLKLESSRTEAVVCGNTFQGIRSDPGGLPTTSLWLVRASNDSVTDNRFLDSDAGLFTRESPGIAIVDNRFERHSGEALDVSFSSPDAEIRGNVFEDNAVGLNARADLDARGNWWGDPSGPSGDGPGEGDPIRTHGNDVPIEPWLTEPPELEAACPGG